MLTSDALSTAGASSVANDGLNEPDTDKFLLLIEGPVSKELIKKLVFQCHMGQKSTF